MIIRFLKLEFKHFFRAASFGKSLAIKLVMGFFALYFMASFLFLGLALYPGLKETMPEEDPFLIVNSFVLYWIIGDFMLRFFLQKLPVMHVLPFLTLPIKRSKIVHYVLGKSVFSFFNFLPLFAIIPFGMSLIYNDYPSQEIVIWMVALVLITLIVNFLNFIIEALTSESDYSYVYIIATILVLFGLNYFEIIPFSTLLSDTLINVTKMPILLLVPIAIIIGLYVYNFKLLRRKLYLDASFQTKSETVNTSDLTWTKRFGDIAPFLQLDLKLLWRNKRPKSSVVMLVLGLFYGLFFYPNPVYSDFPMIYSFVGVFSTGIFVINFGQFIPAWDAGYYKMLMSQNIKYQSYLKSKFILMTLSVIILFILTIPYVYFGWKILLVNFAAAIYNIGINTHVILFAGSFNRKKINLNEKAAFNYQGTSAVQWILGFPLLLLPLGIFAACYYGFNFEVAVATLIVLGLIGVAAHKKLMIFITEKYQDSKYKMINAFGQDS